MCVCVCVCVSLFSWLSQPRPSCGPKRRWRDVVKKDMKDVGIDVGTWYERAQDRKEWYVAYSEGVGRYQTQQRRHRQRQDERTIECSVCRRLFRREADKARHKYVRERARPVEQQRGSVQCEVCGRWFRSRGGLAVHLCSPEEGSQSEPGGAIQCSECGRSFRRPGDLKRHKCRSEREKPIQQQKGAIHCRRCKRWMRSKGGLSVHKCTPESLGATE